MIMSTHDVAEAEGHLSDLIDQALKGEAVVITRQGKPVAEIRPVTPSHPTREEKIAWLEEHRVKLSGPTIDAQAILRQMRDGD